MEKMEGAKTINLTTHEAINLILSFYCFPLGYRICAVDDHPEARRFIDAGYACLSGEHGDLFVPNDKGSYVLHSYIERISREFINFLEDRGMELPIDEAADWFTKTYGLTDIETGRDICEYIRLNLVSYGYEVHECHSRESGFFYECELTSAKSSSLDCHL